MSLQWRNQIWQSLEEGAGKRCWECGGFRASKFNWSPQNLSGIVTAKPSPSSFPTPALTANLMSMQSARDKSVFADFFDALCIILTKVSGRNCRILAATASDRTPGLPAGSPLTPDSRQHGPSPHCPHQVNVVFFPSAFPSQPQRVSCYLQRHRHKNHLSLSHR